jgi:uncharacterized membrane protein
MIRKEEIVDIFSYILSFAIIPIIYFYAKYIGILGEKADLFREIGMLTIVLIWICICLMLSNKIKSMIKRDK